MRILLKAKKFHSVHIEQVIENAAYSSIEEAVKCHKVDETHITAETGLNVFNVKAIKGCPQMGVLSIIIWSLWLSIAWYKNVYVNVYGYADDLVIEVRGKFEKKKIAPELLKQAFNKMGKVFKSHFQSYCPKNSHSSQ